MKNYVVIGEKWKRAIVFTDEHYADLYITKNCIAVCCTKYSAADFEAQFGQHAKKVLEYGLNDYNAQILITINA
ncbi:hypothetical protein [Thiothrix lacustris]|jgi:hypothetical protein|uniref:Uncharacterized protein n=1 Tax=Thiothrix lacustris TaxID=525917 RepID=A0ABY9MMG2_9GAMM|nr:hypothetical protein [Thiothrix lacustris]WML89845.1 hypothetical protein RCF98_12790 [Thiothrix lacustris]WMP18556.1 hypothetical protein RCS87_05735 [Thiothrix lacustris]